MNKLLCRYSLLIAICFQISMSHLLIGNEANKFIEEYTTTDSIQKFLEVAWEYRNNYPDSTIFYANRARALSVAAGRIEQAVQATNYVGVAHRNLGNYSKAFEQYIKALKEAEDNEIIEQQGYTLINLGNLGIYQSDFEGALNYFEQALNKAIVLGDSSMMAYCFLNKGRAFRSYDQFDNAELEISKALEIRLSLDDGPGIIAGLAELGEINRLRKNYPEAISYFEASIAKAQESSNVSAVVYGYNNLALVYLGQGLISKAEYSALKSYELAIATGLKNDIRKAMLTLSNVYENRGDFSKSLQYHKDYLTLDREIFSEENIRKVERLRSQYENEKKDAENDFLRAQALLNGEIISRQRQIIWLIGIGVILLIILVLVAYYAFLLKLRLSKKIKAQKEKIELDKTLIEVQAKKLEEIDRAKSRFFANISHDLRSPLSLILGSIENINDEEKNYLSPSSIHDLEVIQRNSQRLIFLTDEINDLTRLDEGKIKLKFEQVEISPYLGLLVSMFNSTATFKGVQLNYHDHGNNKLVFSIDPRQFEKIVYNLISNAIRHCNEGDVINVNLSMKDNNALIVVEDTGEGINPMSLPYIFDRFYQAPEKKYQAREGLGIGLALVKELVELMHGEIFVSSHESVGTKFTIIMPLVLNFEQINTPVSSDYFIKRKDLLRDTERIANNARRRVEMPVNKPSKQGILIVEDHPEIRLHIRKILESDYKIYEANDGKEALMMMQKETIDLVITDLMMPVMDGFELLEAISKHEQLVKIPVLVVSARTGQKDKERVLATGINDFLSKPFNKSEIIMRVQNLLAQKEKWDFTEQSMISQHVDQKEGSDKATLWKIDNFILENIKEEGISVSQIADTLATSERQVYRIVKKITKMTPLEYIKEFKLQYANELIGKGKVKTASEAARAIGFKNVTQFNKSFHSKYGKKPNEFLISD